MKILALRGAAIASLYAPFEIDFEDGELGRVGLFAITGPTGAGKSSLLDAMCLALFHRTPRLGAASKVKIGTPEREDERVFADDPRSLLSRGAGEGFAEVDFRGADGDLYRARWQVHRARKRANGSFQPPKAMLHRLRESDERPRPELEDLSDAKRTETKLRVQERLGLSFEQFCRSVLLAQGAFAEFLRADARSRGELLERMTGTEIYARISAATYRKAKEVEGELRGIRTQLEGLELLPEDIRTELERDAERKNERLGRERRRAAALEACTRWIGERGELETGLHAAGRALIGAARAWGHEVHGESFELPESMMQATDLVGRHVRRSSDTAAGGGPSSGAAPSGDASHEGIVAFVEGARARVRSARSAHEALVLAATELRENLAHRRRKAEAVEVARAKVQQLEAREVELRDAVAKSAAWVEAHPRARALAAEWNLHEERMRRWSEASRTVERAAEESKALVGKREATRRALDEASADLEVLEARAQAAVAAVTEAEAREGAVDGAGLRDRLRSVESALRAWERAEELVTARVQLRRSESELEAKLGERKSAMAAESLALERARGGLEAAARAFERIVGARSLEAHRHALEADAPCPLCGALEHPYANSEPAFDRLEAEAHAERERAAAQVELHRAELARAEAFVSSAETQLSGYAKQLVQLEHRAEELWGATRGTLGADEPPSDASSTPRRDAGESALDAWARGAASDVHPSERLRATATSIESQLEAHEANRVRSRTAREARDEVRAAIEARSQARAARSEELTRLDARLESLATLELRGKEELERTSEALESLFALDGGDDTAEGRTGLPLDWRSGLVSEAEAFIRTRRAEVEALDDRRRAATLAEAQRAQLAAERVELGERLAASTAEHDALVEQGARLERSHAAAAAELRRWMPAIEETEEPAARLQSATVASEAMSDAWVRLTERAESFVRHDAEPPAALEHELEALAGTQLWADGRPAGPAQWDELREHCLSQRERLLAELEPRENELVAVRGRLAVDEDHRRRRSELAPELEAQSRRMEDWAALNQLIGQSDGQKFRNFAQDLTLRIVLEFANERLRELRPRYQLVPVEDQRLEMQVVDRDMGDELRSLASLSGGESFLVSLALALGLAESTGRQGAVESLFIDEGFGTLDSETLEMAVATLDALQASGRTIGIISHVDGLADRLGVQICVRPHGGGRSRVEIVEG